jgi:hypothetical protein
MLIGRFLLIIAMLSTFIVAALTTNITTNNHYLTPSSTNITEKLELLVIPIQSSSSAADQNECQKPCSIDYCLKYLSISKSCKKLIRNQCDCCTVCLRTENEICGGNFNVYGLCEQDLLCYKTTNNLPEQTGICVKGKEKKKICK